MVYQSRRICRIFCRKKNLIGDIMRYKAILFDLDGTLLPMDNDTFTSAYFKLLSSKLSPYGIDRELLEEATWRVLNAMADNDGIKTNEETYWDVFTDVTGKSQEELGAICDEFYEKDFHRARVYTEENPYARQAVSLAHKLADQVILATNPFFPIAGQETRMSWVGLSSEDFDLVTSYEESHYCKPNPNYYLDVCRQIDAEPQECLLIGNDEDDDMHAGARAGLNCYLVTDSLVPSKHRAWRGAKGSMKDLIHLLEKQVS